MSDRISRLREGMALVGTPLSLFLRLEEELGESLFPLPRVLKGGMLSRVGQLLCRGEDPEDHHNRHVTGLLPPHVRHQWEWGLRLLS